MLVKFHCFIHYRSLFDCYRPILNQLYYYFYFYVPYLNISVLTNFIFFRCGGTVAAIVTCPLEVLKTRLQVSKL